MILLRDQFKIIHAGSMFADGDPVPHSGQNARRGQWVPTGSRKDNELIWRGHCTRCFSIAWDYPPIPKTQAVLLSLVFQYDRPMFHWVQRQQYGRLKTKYANDVLKLTSPDVQDNLVKPVSDALEDAGVFENDCSVALCEVGKQWVNKRADVGVSVEVYLIEPKPRSA